MVIGYQIEVQNDYLKENIKKQNVTEILDFKGDILI